jgi:laminin beta 1
MSDECAKFICNIGVHNAYAFSCDCNPTGSLSLICDWKGGNCQCKSNIVGRKCDECSPSTYGFGLNGCSRKFFSF